MKPQVEKPAPLVELMWSFGYVCSDSLIGFSSPVFGRPTWETSWRGEIAWQD